MLIVLNFTIFLLQGRIMSKRSSSSKLFFYDIHGDGAKLQVMADARCLSNGQPIYFLLLIGSDECFLALLFLINRSAAVNRAWKKQDSPISILV